MMHFAGPAVTLPKDAPIHQHLPTLVDDALRWLQTDSPEPSPYATGSSELYHDKSDDHEVTKPEPLEVSDLWSPAASSLVRMTCGGWHILICMVSSMQSCILQGKVFNCNLMRRSAMLPVSVALSCYAVLHGGASICKHH